MFNSYSMAIPPASSGYRASEEVPMMDTTSPVMSDEEAKKQLPPFNLALLEYHRNRSEGDDPSKALEKTILVWREVWGGGAYVPHLGKR